MGSYFRSNNEKELVKILVAGLDGSGKTTMLYKLTLGEIKYLRPTLGISVEQTHYKNLALSAWDSGRQVQMRGMKKRFVAQDTAGMIFFFDMTDKERLIEAIDELREELNNVEENLRPDQALPLLIFANKTDLPTAMPLQDITNNEEFKSIVKNRNWHIQPSSIAIGTGLYEGIDWFERQVEARRTGAIVACDLKS